MTHRRTWTLVSFIAMLVILLAACSGTPSTANETVVSPEPAATNTPAPAPTATTEPEPEPTSIPAPTSPPEPTATPLPAPTTEPTAEPSLAESLMASFPDTPQAEGEVILIYGYVKDTNGNPIANAAVEFWQTDANGVYDHPGDSSTGSRDQSFQFYGTSVTDEAGLYYFRTVSPGYYEPRPKHIHVKVKSDGRQVLTTQFYFEEDRDDLAGEGLFRQAGDLGELIILKSAGSVNLDGNDIPVLTNDIVIDSGAGAGSLTLTPAQGEGPYYPLVDVAAFDNDLTIVP